MTTSSSPPSSTDLREMDINFDEEAFRESLMGIFSSLHEELNTNMLLDCLELAEVALEGSVHCMCHVHMIRCLFSSGRAASNCFCVSSEQYLPSTLFILFIGMSLLSDNGSSPA